MLPDTLPFLTDRNFWVSFLFGLVTIFLYSKEKFGKPTYDMRAMGPFASLPLEALTLSAQYKQGQRTYITLTLALYAAVCFVGPITFGDDAFAKAWNSAASAAGGAVAVQFGPAFTDSTIWPAIAAAFLVAAGATNDQSLLGRVEFAIRRYSHRTAYIPEVVKDLARNLRDVKPSVCLRDDSDPSKPNVWRRSRLFALWKKSKTDATDADIDRLVEVGKQSDGPSKWLRALIVYSALETLRNDADPESIVRSGELTGARADQNPFIKTDEAFAALGADHAKADPTKTDDTFVRAANDFLNNTSLLLSLLITQRSSSAVIRKEHVRSLGFRDDFRSQRTDSAFKRMVLLGPVIAFVAYAFVSGLSWAWLTQTPVTSIGYLLNIINSLFLLSAFVASFLVLDHERDGLLEGGEWSETRAGYVMSGLQVALLATFICFIVVTLATPFTGRRLWEGISGLLYTISLQFCSVTSIVFFGFHYYRIAARFDHEPTAPTPGQGLASALREPLSWCLAHALVAAALTGFFNYLMASHGDLSQPERSAKTSVQARYVAFPESDPKNRQDADPELGQATAILSRISWALGTTNNPNHARLLIDLDAACDHLIRSAMRRAAAPPAAAGGPDQGPVSKPQNGSGGSDGKAVKPVAETRPDKQIDASKPGETSAVRATGAPTRVSRDEVDAPACNDYAQLQSGGAAADKSLGNFASQIGKLSSELQNVAIWRSEYSKLRSLMGGPSYAWVGLSPESVSENPNAKTVDPLHDDRQSSTLNGVAWLEEFDLHKFIAFDAKRQDFPNSAEAAELRRRLEAPDLDYRATRKALADFAATISSAAGSNGPDVKLKEAANALRDLLYLYKPPTSTYLPAMIASFVMAVGFGLALMLNRRWWLWSFENETTVSLQELRARYEATKPAVPFVQFMTMPAHYINNLTPIEAIQYEPYRRKLLAENPHLKGPKPADPEKPADAPA